MCLFKITTLLELKYILGHQFKLNVSQMEITLSESEEDNICSHKPKQYLEKYIHKQHHEIELLKDNASIQVYNSAISIGDNDITIRIIKNSDNRLNMYEETFYKNYTKVGGYIKKVLVNTQRQKIKKYPFHLNISQMSINLVYSGPENSHSNINIEKLFNMHNISTFNKLYIHSDNIDRYMSNVRQMQYVKTSLNATNVFKGIQSLYNSCVLYSGIDIEKGLTLNRIEICSNMTIGIVFLNTDIRRNYTKLIDTLKTWVDSNLIELLKKIKLNECVYNIDFDYKYYTPYIGNISANVNVTNTTINDIENVKLLLSQDVPQDKFSTRTSIQFSGYEYHNTNGYYKCMYMKLIHEFITSNILFKDMFPIMHVGTNGPSDLFVSISNATSIHELYYMLLLIIGSFKKIIIHDKETLLALSGSILNIDNIRKNARKYGKGVLKLLEKLDPVLFARRKIKNIWRSYSGLCQKAKQRPVPITKDEYEYLHSIVPESVTNISNQTYKEQRLYLFCPYEKYGFLNYHHIQGQTCIIRCTTKPSNKSQYTYCSNTLSAEHMINIQNKYENQTTTLFQPLITKGRKCRLPDELKMVFVDHIMYKANTSFSPSKYSLVTYNKHPFIITRHIYNSTYTIESEYNDNIDYILIIMTDFNDDFFVVINEHNNKPLVFSENPEVKKFFTENIKKTSTQYNFFNYLEKIMHVNINQHYDMTVKQILSYLIDNFKVQYVTDDKYICGIITSGQTNMFYNTPKFYWIFEDTDRETIPIFKAYELVKNNKLSLPDPNLKIDTSKNKYMLDPDYISLLYRDYTDNLIHVIKFMGIDLMIKPFDTEKSAFWNRYDIVYFDYSAILFNNVYQNFEKSEDIKRNQIKILNIAEILKNYIFMYVMIYETLSVSDLKSKLKKLGIVYDGGTFIDYVNRQRKMFVSWRSSKINDADFDEYFEKYASLSVDENIKSIYDKFQSELKFKKYPGELLYGKIITV